MTSTAVQTTKAVLTKADPNELADALRKCDLGNMFTVKTYDTGTVAAMTGGVILPEKALLVQSARVVSATTATVVGTYMVGDASVTKLTAGTASAVGLASLAADQKTIAFTTTDVTRCVVQYVPAPTADITAKFAT